jgi:hypothetical protein
MAFALMWKTGSDARPSPFHLLLFEQILTSKSNRSQIAAEFGEIDEQRFSLSQNRRKLYQ